MGDPQVGGQLHQGADAQRQREHAVVLGAEVAQQEEGEHRRAGGTDDADHERQARVAGDAVGRWSVSGRSAHARRQQPTPRYGRHRMPAAPASEDELRLEPVERLEDVREEWSALAERSGHPFATWEWNSLWWERFGAGRELHSFACRDGAGRIVAILPLHVLVEAPHRGRALPGLRRSAVARLRPRAPRARRGRAQARDRARARCGSCSPSGCRASRDGVRWWVAACCARATTRCCASTGRGRSSWRRAAATSATRCAGASARS